MAVNWKIGNSNLLQLTAKEKSLVQATVMYKRPPADPFSTCTEIHARKRVEKLFLQWKSLEKVALGRTDKQMRKEEKFTADFDK